MLSFQSDIPQIILSKTFFCFRRRIHDNQFICDCRLLWLAKYLKLHPFLGLNARCQNPDTSASKDIVTLIDDEKQCNAMGKFTSSIEHQSVASFEIVFQMSKIWNTLAMYLSVHILARALMV